MVLDFFLFFSILLQLKKPIEDEPYFIFPCRQSGGQWNQAPGNRTTFPKVPSLAPIVPKASNVSTAAKKPSKAPTIPKTRKISKSQSVKKEQAQLTQKKEPKAPKASTSKQVK